MTETRNLSVEVMTRVEGEGAMDLVIRGDRIERLALRIFEPPRLFEKFLEGREYTELPDMVARICGICPVAYQMSAVQAVEDAFGAQITPWIDAMRRLLYCGEWVQSHALHIHLLAAPDFLGYPNAIAMAAGHRDAVARGMGLQSLGNRIMRFCAGRSVHPVGVRPGGFTHAPRLAAAQALLAEVRHWLPAARELIDWTAAIALPDDEQDFVSVAIREAEAYGVISGRLVSSDGLDIGIDEFNDHFTEFQVPHSTSLHASLHGEPYLVGPLPRLNLNRGQLPDQVQQVIADCAIDFPSRNMFHSIVARAIELWYMLLEAERILAAYRPTDRPWVELTPRAGTGHGATEAPRGLLWHRYEFDDEGLVRKATITPPTSQNQARIEQDLAQSLLAYGLDHSDDELRLRGEMVIRNYDPCISCSTHFLRLNVTRD